MGKGGAICLFFGPNRVVLPNSLGNGLQIVHNEKEAGFLPWRPVHGPFEIHPMSPFGKILVFLNVLAAVAFFFVAMMDYAKRQTWADLALQREVQMQGIPLDENEPDIDGRPRVLDLRQSFVDGLFRD